MNDKLKINILPDTYCLLESLSLQTGLTRDQIVENIIDVVTVKVPTVEQLIEAFDEVKRIKENMK